MKEFHIAYDNHVAKFGIFEDLKDRVLIGKVKEFHIAYENVAKFGILEDLKDRVLIGKVLTHKPEGDRKFHIQKNNFVRY